MTPPAPLITTPTFTVWQGLRSWTARRWAITTAVAALTIIIIGIPTVLIPNPIFSRDVPVTWWAWPALIVTAILAGMVTATYVRSPLADEPKDRQGKLGMLGGILGFFAVGCPVCNKLVLIALGTTGAMQYFAPIQPLIAVVSVGLLAWALYARITKENACPMPSATASASISS